MDTTTEGALLCPVAARLQQTLEIQQSIVLDCAERADYWRSLGRDAQADVWCQFAENAAQVLRGIERTGNPNYCPF